MVINTDINESIKTDLINGNLTRDQLLEACRNQVDKIVEEAEKEKTIKLNKELAEKNKIQVGKARGAMVDATIEYLDALNLLSPITELVPLSTIKTLLNEEFQNAEKQAVNTYNLGQKLYENKIADGAKKAKNITQQPFSIEDAFLKNFKANL